MNMFGLYVFPGSGDVVCSKSDRQIRVCGILRLIGPRENGSQSDHGKCTNCNQVINIGRDRLFPNMQHPFQCLEICSRADATENEVLVAAAGHQIHAYSLYSGGLLATWPAARSGRTGHSGDTIQRKQHASDVPHDKDEVGSPSKRRKLSENGSDSTSAEIVVERDADPSAPQEMSKSPVIKLARTSDGRHLIAVTGDDKCVRVFDLLPDGALHQLSER